MQGQVVDRFDNRDYDDAGYRTELTVRHGGRQLKLVADHRVEIVVGRSYTFFVDESSSPPELTEIRDGSTTIWRQSGQMGLQGTVSEASPGVLEVVGSTGTKRFPWPATLSRDIIADLEQVYVIEIAYTDGAEGRCETLRAIGLENPGATEEVFDPRMGPYEVPRIDWIWKAPTP